MADETCEELSPQTLKERDDYLESRETEILAFHSKVRTNDVLREVWDEAQRQALSPALRPIETAPKNGTWILLVGDSGYKSAPFRAAVCRNTATWAGDVDWRDHAGDRFTDGGGEPTHWMPAPTLPPAPKTLSDSLSDITLRFDLDEEALDIICRAAEQLHKQEQADDWTTPRWHWFDGR